MQPLRSAFDLDDSAPRMYSSKSGDLAKSRRDRKSEPAAVQSVAGQLAQAPSELAERHQRKIMRVHVVPHVEMIREAIAGEGSFVPRSDTILMIDQPAHSAQNRFPDRPLAREEPDQRPRRLRRCTFAASAP